MQGLELNRAKELELKPQTIRASALHALAYCPRLF